MAAPCRPVTASVSTPSTSTTKPDKSFDVACSPRLKTHHARRRLAIERQDSDLFKFRVNDPVLGDTGPGVFLAFVFKSRRRSSSQRRPPPSPGRHPPSIRLSSGWRVPPHKQDIGLAILAWPEPHANAHEEDFAKIQSEDTNALRR